VIKCDASILGVGGVLINRYPHGDRVIKCVSHAFTDTETRWKTLEQEAFAVVFTVLYFRTVLYGQFFLVETDHGNLTFVHAGTSAKVTRWSLVLQRFSFGISFIPGQSNVIADALSRAPADAPLNLHAIRLSDFFETGPVAGFEVCQWGAGDSPLAKSFSDQKQSGNALALCPMKLRLKKKRDDVSNGESQEHAGASTQGISTGK